MAFDPFTRSEDESSYAPFWETGVYELQASFWTYHGIKIFSNIVKIVVEEPEGVDAEAIGVWKDEEIFLTLQQSGDTLRATQGFEKMKRVVESYPESTYGKIAADALRERGLIEDSVETVSEAETIQAEEDPERSSPDFPVKVDWCSLRFVHLDD